jgi:hypothetical protein
MLDLALALNAILQQIASMLKFKLPFPYRACALVSR